MTQLEATPHADRYTPSFSVFPYLSPFLSLSHSLTAWPTDFQWHLIALFCFGFFSHIFSLVFHIMVHTLCSAYLSRGQEAVWTPPTSPHTPPPLPATQNWNAVFGRASCAFCSFKQFRVFSLGQVLLPLNATRIAYFVLALALALALTCCCSAAYDHRYLWLCQHLVFNFNFIFIFIAPVRRSRTSVDNKLPSSTRPDPIRSPDL